jgi:hypothetical protein
MTDEPTITNPDAVPVPLGLQVEASPIRQIAKGQLRVAVAALAGALVLRNVLPAALVNDQTLDAITGIALLALVAAWTWLRDRLTHSRFFALAVDPQVPGDAVRLKASE